LAIGCPLGATEEEKKGKVNMVIHKKYDSVELIVLSIG
jgi:hypothetical protein